MQPLVSVIVPVYKVEGVLTRCLDSLCRQSLKEIEIILVDDDSPDRCRRICEEYAKRDSRFRVFYHPENRGLSAARNTGIANASADYLMFVDSDDWVDDDFCKLPYECALQHHADLVMFGRYYVDKDGVQRNILEQESVMSEIKTPLETIDLLLTNAVGNYAWNKLYKKALFHTVSYPEEYLFEDIGTTYKTAFLADTVYFLNEKLYYYCYREDSIVAIKSEKAFRDFFVMQMRQYKDLAAWGYPSEKLECLLQNIALTYCIRKKADWRDTDDVFCLKILKAARKIPEHFTWKRKVLFVLQKYCPPVFDLVCNLWGKRRHFVKCQYMGLEDQDLCRQNHQGQPDRVRNR